MSHSSKVLTCPGRRQSADCFLYVMIKYHDWLVIGGVSGGGRA